MDGILNLKAESLKNNLAEGSADLILYKDSLPPQAPTFVVPASALSIYGQALEFGWTAMDQGMAGLKLTGTYEVEVFSNGTCSGSADTTLTQTSSVYSYSGLSNGNTYSIRVKAEDALSQVGAPSCSSAVTVNAVSPTLALSDGTTSSVTTIRQPLSSVAIASDAMAQKWCLSETQTTAPLTAASACSGGQGSSLGWHTTRPTTFTFSTGDGLKTLYLWVADASGTVLPSAVTDTITLSSALPATPGVAVTSQTTNSATNTNQSLLDLSITADTGAVKWCVGESLDSAADPVAPLYNDVCFVSSRPTAYTLTGRGVRRVSVWTQNSNNVVSLAGTDTIDFPLPSTLALAGPSSIIQSECSAALTVTQKDAYGLVSLAPTATTVALTGKGAGNFYSDLGCTSVVTSVSITSGQSSQKFYFKSSTRASYTFVTTAFSSPAQLISSVVGLQFIESSENGTTCAIVLGALQCWGNNNYGQLGIGTVESSSVPRQVSGLLADATYVDSGTTHTCAVINGSVKCWGRNNGGQLGTGTNSDSSTPVSVTGAAASGVLRIGAGHNFSCALVGEAAYCWGE
jgi:hypothetical protein